MCQTDEIHQPICNVVFCCPCALVFSFFLLFWANIVHKDKASSSKMLIISRYVTEKIYIVCTCVCIRMEWSANFYCDKYKCILRIWTNIECGVTQLHWVTAFFFLSIFALKIICEWHVRNSIPYRRMIATPEKKIYSRMRVKKRQQVPKRANNANDRARVEERRREWELNNE